jgi:hypothetical protein
MTSEKREKNKKIDDWMLQLVASGRTKNRKITLNIKKEKNTSKLVNQCYDCRGPTWLVSVNHNTDQGVLD